MNLGFVSSGRTQYVHKQHRKKKNHYFSAQGISPQKKKDKFGFQGERRGVKVINLRAFLPF